MEIPSVKPSEQPFQGPAPREVLPTPASHGLPAHSALSLGQQRQAIDELVRAASPDSPVKQLSDATAMVAMLVSVKVLTKHAEELKGK